MRKILIQCAEMSPEMLALIKKLKSYCDGARGRRAEVARVLKISPSGLWNILNEKQEPTGSQALKILEILGKR